MNADFAGGEDALEFLVGVGLEQQLARVQYEVAAVGAVQGARPQQSEIGQQRAHLRHVFGTADEIGLGRIVLVNDGRTHAVLAGRVADQDIDLVTAKGALRRRHPG